MYLLDANVFIQAKNMYYAPSFCPAFWEWLVENNHAEKVFSVEQVSNELIGGSDELAEWAKEQGKGFFLPPDEQTLQSMSIVSQWVSSQQYEIAAVNTFLHDADYYLISHAHAYEYAVVTHEIPGDSPKRVKIPNVCVGLKIEYMNTFDMLRRERARFVLHTSRT